MTPVVHIRFAKNNQSSLARSMIAHTIGCTRVQSDEGGRPIPVNGYHWSLSHAGNYVATAVTDATIGIDIEPVRECDPALLGFFPAAEWHILGERNWPQFYRLWTAKEALSKKLGIGLDALQDIALKSASSDTITLEYHHTLHRIRVCTHDDAIYSYTL